MQARHLFLGGLYSLLSFSSASGTVTFVVNFSAQAQADLSPAEQALFTDAVNFWDDIILGYRDGVSRTYTLEVNTFNEGPSGGAIALGGATPTFVGQTGVVATAHTTNQRFIYAAAGLAEFNVNEAAGPLDPAVIRHEIGHALGIGTLWEENEVHNDGFAPNDSQFGGDRTLVGGTPGQYVGPNALVGFQAEFDSAATFIPVERDGGGGTANAHWNEVADNPNFENSPGFDSDPGDGEDAPTDPMGRSLDDELMTGFRSGESYLSATTILSLRDIGFSTIDPFAIPEPSTGFLMIGGLLLVGRRRR